jgi:hypothetical protein
MQADPQRSENRKTLEPTNACPALAEASRGMANEGCTNEAHIKRSRCYRIFGRR